MHQQRLCFLQDSAFSMSLSVVPHQQRDQTHNR
nr:MAG TPA: hypothetical protein [Caudoviricetes sp.]